MPIGYIPILTYDSLHGRELLDALHKRGFRTNEGIDGTGFLPLLWRSFGGFYLGAVVSLQFLLSHSSYRD